MMRKFRNRDKKGELITARVETFQIEEGRYGWSVRIHDSRGTYFATPPRLSKIVALRDLEHYHPEPFNSWIEVTI